MLKVMLCGNPNTGKSTIFNLLTRSHLKTGNWHGVTVKATSKVYKANNKLIELTDIPGLYSLKPYSLEERVAAKQILFNKCDIVLNVCQASSFERCYNLTKELIASKIKCAIILNMYGEFEKFGGVFDAVNFAKSTNIPVFIIKKINKTTKNALNSFILQTINTASLPQTTVDILKFYKSPKPKLSRLDDIFLNVYLALPIFFGIFVIVFYLTFGKNMPGDMAKCSVENLFKKIQLILDKALFFLGAPDFFIGLVGAIISAAAVLFAFVPQLTILFLFLIVLEQSGYISRLAFMSDNVFIKLGLSGRAIFSILLGFGCTAAAVATTRALDQRVEQRRAVYALSFIPCSAKLPVIAMLAQAFFYSSFGIIIAVYVGATLLSFLFAFLANKKCKLNAQFIVELAPYRLPNIVQTLKTLHFQIKQFIIKIGAVVVPFIVLMWLCLSISPSFKYLGQNQIDKSILAKIGGLIKYIFYPIGITKWQIPVAAISGLVAKETVAGVLGMLYPNGLLGVISPSSCLAFIAFIATYTTCIAAVIATAREIGYRAALKLAAFEFLFALLLSYIVYFVCLLLSSFGAKNIIFLSVTIIIILLSLNVIFNKKNQRKKCNACFYCKRTNDT